MPLPLLVTTLVKLTVEPGAAGPATVWPVIATEPACVTVKGVVFDEPVTVVAPLL